MNRYKKYQKANDSIHAPEELKKSVLQHQVQPSAPHWTSPFSSSRLRQWGSLVAVLAILLVTLSAWGQCTPLSTSSVGTPEGGTCDNPGTQTSLDPAGPPLPPDADAPDTPASDEGSYTLTGTAQIGTPSGTGAAGDSSQNETAEDVPQFDALINGSANKPEASDSPASMEGTAQAAPADKNRAVLTMARAQYPEMAPYPAASGESDGAASGTQAEDLYEAWAVSVQQLNSGQDYSSQLVPFVDLTARTLLPAEDGENAVYSPLNLYMELTLTAEATAGDSREQILSLLGADSIQELRDMSHSLWQDNYRDDGRTSSVLANSLWLNQDTADQAQEDTVSLLADSYYADVYAGPMGDPQLDAALQDWVDTKTGGLLKEYSKRLSFSQDTVLSLVSAIYFNAAWENPFEETATAPGIFHSPQGDIQTDFMHQTSRYSCYQGEEFSSVTLPYQDSGYEMVLVLPQEGSTPADLLESGGVLSFLASDSSASPTKVRLSLPKFDISAGTDLTQSLQALGVQDIFSTKTADFSSLTQVPGTYVSQIIHAARVIVDESKTEAAAVTWLEAPGAAMSPDEILEFTLDRPFLFAVLGPDRLPLFLGVVQQPNGGV